MGSQRVGISDAFHDGREEEEMGKIHRRLSNEESSVPPFIKKKKKKQREGNAEATDLRWKTKITNEP